MRRFDARNHDLVPAWSAPRLEPFFSGRPQPLTATLFRPDRFILRVHLETAKCRPGSIANSAHAI